MQNKITHRSAAQPNLHLMVHSALSSEISNIVLIREKLWKLYCECGGNGSVSGSLER